MQSPIKKESISNSFLRGSIQSFQLQKSSIDINWKPTTRQRKLSPWESKMQNSKMFKTYRKNNQNIEKTDKSEQFLKKIFPKHSRSPQNKPNQHFQQLISPAIKKSLKIDNKAIQDQNFVSSFVYLPIRPIKIETEPNQSAFHNKQLTLTSFRQKMMRSTNRGKTVAPKEMQISFSTTTYRSSTAQGKMKSTNNNYFRRKLKKKQDAKLKDSQNYPQRKGTLNDMYNLLGIKQQKTKYPIYLKGECDDGSQKSKGFKDNYIKNNVNQDLSWCISRKSKRNKTKKSSIVCKTVYI